MIAGLALTHAVFELGLVLIDPKRRGYVPFAGLPHLVHPVIHEPEAAAGALAWTVEELERRDREGVSTPRLVVFIDELADLVLASSSHGRTETQTAIPRPPAGGTAPRNGGQGAEASLTRLVQRGREAGLHVVACTQKPTAGVIGSLVKANFPARIVGRVTDTNDAYVAAGISGTGAERLLGRGDFLVVTSDVTRIQAAYISEAEIRDLVTRLRGGRPANDATSPLANGKLLDFVARYQEREDAGVEHEPHNKTPPTEAMIAYALAELQEQGQVSQRAVQRFHQSEYGALCNTRRAQAAIEAAQQRYRTRNGSSRGATAAATASLTVSEDK